MIVYSYFEKGCQKKCLRQSQKVEFTGLQRNLKKWEITTPMVIFDDRPSSTVVKIFFSNHLLRLHVNLCQIPYMTKHALIITRTLQTGLPLRASRDRGFPSATFIATTKRSSQSFNSFSFPTFCVCVGRSYLSCTVTRNMKS